MRLCRLLAKHLLRLRFKAFKQVNNMGGQGVEGCPDHSRWPDQPVLLQLIYSAMASLTNQRNSGT